ncbi:MAG: IclR family transcriptional regulator [Rhodobiaceae bacterium]|nr:IclR family transcriptional regulator [Rhodobiaceae bacterium]MCC0051767.1 IclR family transcriptional regulator [Rhodobiaceae bacterium]MCC0060438.1 IclR family transcriptional regulator [Rhodobiaceae bacterium]
MVELDKSTNQSTQVAFLLIEKMVEIGEPVGLSELARRIGMPRARTHRFLRTLASMDYVTQDPETERYRLTLKLYHIGQAISDRTGLLTEARPLMTILRNELQTTVTLSLLEETGMRVLDIVRAESPVQIVTRPGSLLDFHSSAQGKVALAFGPETLWDIVRAKPLQAWTENTNTDLSALESEVKLTCKRGWADAPDQTLMGVNAVSAPIFDLTNQMQATVTVAGPNTMIGSPPKSQLVDRVVAAARSISRNLGNTEYPA